jgi:hypothetical protein
MIDLRLPRSEEGTYAEYPVGTRAATRSLVVHHSRIAELTFFTRRDHSHTHVVHSNWCPSVTPCL